MTSQAILVSKNKGNWLTRLGRKITGAFSGLASGSSASAYQHSYVSPAGTSAGAGSSVSLKVTAMARAAVTAPPPPLYSSLLEAMIDPQYRTGSAGEDLMSGNYHWSLPLVSLPGRNRLDASLGLHYNSLVWMRYSNTMAFDPDYYATLTPGFRLGFPEISDPFLVSGNPAASYMVTLPSGRHMEMRWVSGNTYEATDSSYLQLIATPSIGKMKLQTTDGTQFFYDFIAAGYRCTKVLDSNGNYLTITWTAGGGIDRITDTLGRVLIFTYDGYNHLQTITQQWQGQVFTWAQFEYSSLTIQTNFPGLTIDGPTNGTPIPVITRVITGDGARHRFLYNSYGMVREIWRDGESNNALSGTEYAFPTIGGANTDCPRFSQRWDYLAGWSGSDGYGWVLSNFSFVPDYNSTEGYGLVTGPDGVSHQEWFYNSGPMRGLTKKMETWHGGAVKKHTEYTWAVDNTTGLPLRPRLTRTKIVDNTNGSQQRQTDMTYTQIAGTNVRLPHIVKEFGNVATQSVYRSTKTTYNQNTNYLSRWIIGLPETQELFEGDAESGGTRVAKTEYLYDGAGGGGFTYLLWHNSNPTRHDSTNYGGGFTWRGNLTNVRRYSVTSGVASNPTETRTGYYITGHTAWAQDAVGNTSTIEYEDAFTAGQAIAGPKYAYPTKVTDPAGNSAIARYHLDFGAVTETVDAKNYMNNQTNPHVRSTTTYDSKGRPYRSSVWQDGVEHRYTQITYWPTHDFYLSQTTVNHVSELTTTWHFLDGAGSETVTFSEHPGSAGQYRASYVVYDQNRRVSVSANPAELTAGWQFAGDDAGNTAWIVSTQQYDWKGRPTTTTHQDGSSRTIDYTGCGCAGQDIVTSTDEVGRKRMAQADVFGRVVKSQIFKADGLTPYSTSITEYNVRDQVLMAKQFKGDASPGDYCPLGNCEEVDNAYDGYGRLERRWLPVYQNAGVAPPYSANGSAKFMQWQYRNDDRVQVLTDPRGATRTYGYNSRGLVSSLSYGGTGAEATDSATFDYNENGQRTLMDDGPGQVTYNYDFLGQMISETRVFNKTGWMSGSFTISYNEYWAAGHLKKITDPFGARVRYDYDKTARLTAVTGETTFAGQSNYVYAGYNGGLKYRAWDGLKDGRTYDERMRVKTYGGFGGITYTYNAASDLIQAAQNGAEPYHQTFSYDETGRQTGVSTPEMLVPEAFRMSPGSSPPDGLPPTLLVRPFTSSITYDEFGHVTSRTSKYWHDHTGNNQPEQKYETTFEGGRPKKDGVSGRVSVNAANSIWTYNALGETINDGQDSQLYDAEGRLVRTQNLSTATVWVTHDYDGDGQQVRYQRNASSASDNLVRYRLYSTVLGQVLTEVDSAGQKVETYVRTLPTETVRQVTAYTAQTGQQNPPTYPEMIVSEHLDPHGTRLRNWDRNANTFKDTHLAGAAVTMDAIDWGILKTRFVTGIQNQVAYAVSQAHYPGPAGGMREHPNDPARGCSLDGQKVSCEKVFAAGRRGELKSLALSTTGLGGGDEGALIGAMRLAEGQSRHSRSSYFRRRAGYGTGLKVGDEVITAGGIDEQPYFEEVISNQVEYVMTISGGGDGISSGKNKNAQSKKPPCPPVPEAPSDASVDENILRARQHRPKGIFTAYNSAQWFKGMVTHKGPWDYKRRTDIILPSGKRKYEDFGNFNYGATGTAIGFDLVTLHSEAGKVQALPRDPVTKKEMPKPESWGYPAGRFFGSGKYPYGDEPGDAEQTIAGRNYYLHKFVYKDCE